MDYETKQVSVCCTAGVHETDESTEDCPQFKCDKCEGICDVTEVCSLCNGTGEVDTMETVYAGEPHQAPIGTEKCICQLGDVDDYDDGDYY